MIANLKGAYHIWRNALDIASVGANLTTSSLVGTTLDGFTITATTRVLVKDQTTTTQNGIYINNVLVYEYDDNSSAVPHGVYYVISGTINGNTYFTCDSTGHIFTKSFGGTVTSVGLTMPSIFSVSGSPVTNTGTLAVSLVSETANTFFAAPNGSAGNPTFRTITTADLPTFPTNSVIFSNASGVLSTNAGALGWTDTLKGLGINGSPTSFANLNVAGNTRHQGMFSGNYISSINGVCSNSGATITATSAIFTAAMVGGVILSITAANSTSYLVASYVNSTTITISILGGTPSWTSVAFFLLYAGFTQDCAGNTTFGSNTILSLQSQVNDSSNSSGSSGQVLTSNGTTVSWKNLAALSLIATIYVSANSAFTITNGSATSIIPGTNYTLYGISSGPTNSTVNSYFTYVSTTNGYGIQYSGPTGLNALVKLTSQCSSTVCSGFVAVCFAYTANTTTAYSFANTGYTAFWQTNPYTASTTFNLELSGYFSLTNGYIYAPCVYNNSGGSVTFTTLVYGKYTIQTF